MPRKSGVEVVEELKKFIADLNSRSQQVQVLEPKYVILTAYVSQDFRISLSTLGVTCFEKPLRFDQLSEIIRQTK